MPLRYSKGSSPGCPSVSCSAASSAPPLTLRTRPDSSSLPRSRRMVASEDRAILESSPTEANLFWRSTRRSRACRSAESTSRAPPGRRSPRVRLTVFCVPLPDTLLSPADCRAHAPEVCPEVRLSIEKGRGSRDKQIGARIDHARNVFPAHVSVHLDLDVEAPLLHPRGQSAQLVQRLGNQRLPRV